MAPRVVVLVNGRLVAEGETAAIRELIPDRPRTRAHRDRRRGQALARELVGAGLVARRALDDGALVVDTADVDALRPPPACRSRATWARRCGAWSRWATTSRASTRTCTTARAGGGASERPRLPPHAAPAAAGGGARSRCAFAPLLAALVFALLAADRRVATRESLRLAGRAALHPRDPAVRGARARRQRDRRRARGRHDPLPRRHAAAAAGDRVQADRGRGRYASCCCCPAWWSRSRSRPATTSACVACRLGVAWSCSLVRVRRGFGASRSASRPW